MFTGRFFNWIESISSQYHLLAELSLLFEAWQKLICQHLSITTVTLLLKI